MHTDSERPDFLLGAVGGGGGSPPPPSPEEVEANKTQTEVMRYQLELAKQQQANSDAMMPYYLDSLGYDLGEYSGEGPKLNIGGNEFGVTKRDDPAGDLNKQIEQEGAQRTLKALRGELDVDPAVSQDLARQKEQLHEELLRRLGPGYQNSDAGIRALAEFDRNANTLNYGVRHGELTAAQAIQMNAQNQGLRRADQAMSGIQSFNQFPGQSSQTAGGAGSTASNLSQRLNAARMNVYGINSQNAAAQGQATGQMVGGGLMAAAAIGIAV